jgi:hypothetical protein
VVVQHRLLEVVLLVVDRDRVVPAVQTPHDSLHGIKQEYTEKKEVSYKVPRTLHGGCTDVQLFLSPQVRIFSKCDHYLPSSEPGLMLN